MKLNFKLKKIYFSLRERDKKNTTKSQPGTNKIDVGNMKMVKSGLGNLGRMVCQRRVYL